MIAFGLRAETQENPSMLGAVAPGSFMTISDLSEGRPALVVIHCYPDDEGGVIYRAPDQEVSFEPTGTGDVRFPLDVIAEDNVLHRIQNSEYYEHPIITAAHASAYLAVHHAVK